MPLQDFHPAVAAWFSGAFPAPTQAQVLAWPAIASGRNTLVAAPTGSGKTLTAFMTAIDALVREGLAAPGGAGLSDETHVVYVSPLKALSNDIHLNLEAPLAGIRAELAKQGLPDVDIRTAVRTGDTPQSERVKMRRTPPHILVTTPESLYVLLGSDSGRKMLATTRTVIVDEIHAVADNKRGSHLSLTLERLEALCGRKLVRIGLSATQKPIEEIARFLVGTAAVVSSSGDAAVPSPADALAPSPVHGGGSGWGPAEAGQLEALGGVPEAQGKSRTPIPTFPRCAGEGAELQAREATGLRAGEGAEAGRVGVPDCQIIDIGYVKQRDLALELPPVPLQAVMSNEQWALVYTRLAQLVQAHRTTLVFVNTRRMAERAARHLGELLGKEAVAAHHGSLSRELRLDAEQRLKRGDLRVLVATASLELGIDIGDVDLVCQLGSPRSIAALLQRVGRAGHHVGGVPKGRLFPQSRDDLIECAALLDCVRRGELDTLEIPRAPLDVLAQQIVAEVAATEWNEDALYDWVRRAWPYAQLQRADYDAVVRMLADGFTTRRGPRAAYIHRDAVNRRLRGRKGGRMTAVMSGGTIPDTGDYAVILEPQAITIGNVNEDFAIESLAGDVFQLGNTSYKILRVEPGRVRVEDAQGAPPNIPFWLGEAPGRTNELSLGVSRLRAEIDARLGVIDASPDKAITSVPGDVPSHGAALAWLIDEVGLDHDAALQIVDYLARTRAALGLIPTQDTLAIERFFDESGGTQLVIHTPYGSRINRAWGLALRKRFCRKFNFELQAAATEDAIVLSLSTSHSFPLIDVAHYLHSSSACDVLVQALLDAPLFGVRWRWAATTALALPRFSGGKKVPPQLQRMRSEDLLATVFPDQVACAENLVGEREVPDHPLIAQTLHDCLHEAMDADGWLAVLRKLEGGEIKIVARDLTAPSPIAAEALNARPYAFLDDAPLEERRTQAVMSRRYADADSADDLGRLDPGAIESVREEAWPQAGSADEMHEALMGLGFVTSEEAQANPPWPELLQRLADDRRATRLLPEGSRSDALWVAAERLPQLQALFAGVVLQPAIEAPAEYAREPWTREDALLELARSRLSGFGPMPAATLAQPLAVPTSDIEGALLRLESEGYVMRGRFTATATATAAATQGDTAEEWCERHLLARIHRYTIGRLRREIEPVEPRDFMRFLCDWQHVSPATRMSGPEALAGVLAQLEGFEAPAAAWEKDLLPARMADYAPSWLDDLCTTGSITWARLRASTVDAGGGKTVRGTPIVLLPRRQLSLWSDLTNGATDDAAALSSRAELVVGFLHAHGASFFDELISGAHLLRTELEDALAELVARGRITCDSFAGLRALLVPGSKRPSAHPRRGRRASLFGIEGAGRWTLTRRAVALDRHPSVLRQAQSLPSTRSGDERNGAPATAVVLDRHPRESGDPATFALSADTKAKSLGSRFRGNDGLKHNGAPARSKDPAAIEHIARTLLQRYGVICWRLLEREAAWLPPWRELLRVYHRLEARGEIRGGRFVAGLSGEQFALPEAIGALRAVRNRPHDGALLRLSALDPLNLVGTLLPGAKLPRLLGTRVVYRDGLPLATLMAGSIELLGDLSPADQQAVRHALLRGTQQTSVSLPLSASSIGVFRTGESAGQGLTRH